MDSHPRIAPDFDRFFADEFPAIARATWFVVLDDGIATEVTQEAFCRALQRWSRVAHYERPGAWVRTVAIRLALRHRDRRRREAALTDAALPASPVGLDDAVIASTELKAALATLPAQQRAAIVLHYLCDLDAVEVAAAIGCKPGTARVHLHRGRQALANRLGAHDDLVR